MSIDSSAPSSTTSSNVEGQEVVSRGGKYQRVAQEFDLNL